MNMTVIFEDMKDIEGFVKAWAPVFNPGSQQPVATPQPVASVTVAATPAAVPVAATPIVPPTPPQAPASPVVPPTPPQAPSAPQAPVTPPPAAVPTTAVTYTLDDLARAAMSLMDSGRQNDLQQMLARFGVQSLPELPQAQYGAFATELRTMGAQI
ncbi:MAG: hypothetical protein ACRDBO_06135 [Lachnospiraceae bacterium]